MGTDEPEVSSSPSTQDNAKLGEKSNRTLITRAFPVGTGFDTVGSELRWILKAAVVVQLLCARVEMFQAAALLLPY